MIVYINFFDSMLFRKCMPFDAGIHRRATSFFPPTPTTIQGAIRSLIISKSGINYSDWMKFIKNKSIQNNETKLIELKEKIGDNKSIGKLILKGPFIAKKIEEKNNFILYFNPPLDLVKKRKKEFGDIYKLKLVKTEIDKYSFQYNNNLKNLLWYDSAERVENIKEFFISEDGLIDYLLGKNLNFNSFIKSEKVYKIERRPGIWRENRTTKEGMLYYADYVRIYENFGLIEEIKYIDNENLEIDNNDFFPFGGQSKLAKFEEITKKPFEKFDKVKYVIKEKINSERRFKLIFITPTYIENNLYLNIDNDILNLKAELITASIETPLVIGGWDYVLNEPKEATKYIPAGSVFYYKLKEGCNLNDDEFEKLWFNSILKNNLNQFGYGITLYGVW